MTLAELLPAVQQLPLAEKRNLIRILAAEAMAAMTSQPWCRTTCTSCRCLTTRTVRRELC
jgi:hypothetical protein